MRPIASLAFLPLALLAPTVSAQPVEAGVAPSGSAPGTAAPPPSALAPIEKAEKPHPKAFIFMQVENAPGGSYSDASGGVDITRARATLDLLLPVADKDTLGVGFLGEYGWYQFDTGSGPSAFGKPWGDVTGEYLSLSYSHPLDDQWTLFGGGGVESMREVGADATDSLHYSGAIGGRYAFGEDLSVGLVAAFQTSLEDTPTYFAMPTIDWKIDEHWKLTSGVGRAPGVGIEYGTLDRQWAIALRTRYEYREFRLAKDNAVSPEGVGIDRRLPVYFDIDWNLSEQFSLNAMAGVAFFQRLAYQDAGGVTINRTDMDPAPFFSFGVALRF